MGKEEIKAVSEVLGNKKKFSRVMLVVIALCVTIVIIAGIGFYTGAITWHGGK